MTKAEFIDVLAEKSELTKAQAHKGVDAFTEIIVDAVASGDKISLQGFGTFEQVERGAREGRNPHSGEKLMIAASKAPKFTASSVFKKAVKGTAEE